MIQGDWQTNPVSLISEKNSSLLEDIITLWLALGMSCLLKSQNIEARTPRPTGKMEQAAVIT